MKFGIPTFLFYKQTLRRRVASKLRYRIHVPYFFENLQPCKKWATVTTIWTISAVTNFDLRGEVMTEVLVHLDVNIETRVPAPQVAIETGVPEVTVEMVEVVEDIVAEIGFLLLVTDAPICLLLIKG